MSAAPTRPAVLLKRSLEQRRRALAQANQVRSQRAQLKTGLREGRCSLAELIGGPPDYLATAKAAELLEALPHYGSVKVARPLARCRISPKKTLAGLSPRQRRELVAALEGE